MTFDCTEQMKENVARGDYMPKRDQTTKQPAHEGYQIGRETRTND